MVILLLINLLVSNALTLRQEKSILFFIVGLTGLISSSILGFINLYVKNVLNFLKLRQEKSIIYFLFARFSPYIGPIYIPYFEKLKLFLFCLNILVSDALAIIQEKPIIHFLFTRFSHYISIYTLYFEKWKLFLSCLIFALYILNSLLGSNPELFTYIQETLTNFFINYQNLLHDVPLNAYSLEGDLSNLDLSHLLMNPEVSGGNIGGGSGGPSAGGSSGGPGKDPNNGGPAKGEPVNPRKRKRTNSSNKNGSRSSPGVNVGNNSDSTSSNTSSSSSSESTDSWDNPDRPIMSVDYMRSIFRGDRSGWPYRIPHPFDDGDGYFNSGNIDAYNNPRGLALRPDIMENIARREVDLQDQYFNRSLGWNLPSVSPDVAQAVDMVRDWNIRSIRDIERSVGSPLTAANSSTFQREFARSASRDRSSQSDVD